MLGQSGYPDLKLGDVEVAARASHSNLSGAQSWWPSVMVHKAKWGDGCACQCPGVWAAPAKAHMSDLWHDKFVRCLYLLPGQKTYPGGISERVKDWKCRAFFHPLSKVSVSERVCMSVCASVSVSMCSSHFHVHIYWNDILVGQWWRMACPGLQFKGIQGCIEKTHLGKKKTKNETNKKKWRFASVAHSDRLFTFNI